MVTHIKRTVAAIFGTRPEAIKLAPVVQALQAHCELRPAVCVTGQHREMLAQVLKLFRIVPDRDLGLMQHDQSLAELTARGVAAVDRFLAESRPAMVLVQGDTTSVLCAALAAFYRGIPVAHVEAGLRTWRKRSPFPEEMNRVLVTRVADLHFAPTVAARDNLLKEGIPSNRVIVTGNTVVDALRSVLDRVRTSADAVSPPVRELLTKCGDTPLVLITGHRRENFGSGFKEICAAIRELARQFSDVHFIYPVHLNPNVREPVYALLRGLSNVYLIEPVGYSDFVALMDRSTLVLTDSGGVQEEAPALGKPVVVTRESTERPEVIEAGLGILVGAEFGRIVDAVSGLLTNPKRLATMSRATDLYGDGRAAGRIVDACANLCCEGK